MGTYLIHLVTLYPLSILPKLFQQGTLENYTPLILAILGSSVITAMITFWLTRRKFNADATSSEVDADKKMSDLLKDMQSQVTDLYKKNIELEKDMTDKGRQIEILTTRLETRDQQLAASNKDLELLRNLAEQTPITDMLRSQLDQVNSMVANMQSAQNTLSTLLIEKERSLQELSRTNRDIQLKKPPKA